MAFGDNGTRYDEKCDGCKKTTEVCNDCGCCESCCSCEQRKSDAQEVREFEKQFPGKLDRLTKHLEQGGQEVD